MVEAPRIVAEGISDQQAADALKNQVRVHLEELCRLMTEGQRRGLVVAFNIQGAEAMRPAFIAQLSISKVLA